MSTLVIFARSPALGAVETRLGRSVGNEAARALHEAFLDDACAQTQGLGARRVLAVTGGIDHPQLERLAKSQRLGLVEQGDGDRCARIGRAIATHVDGGPVVVINACVPTLPREHLHQALDLLMDHDVVAGPAPRGSYYLFGARTRLPGTFGDLCNPAAPVPLTEALAKLPALTHALVPEWYEVDDGDTLTRLRSELETLPPWAAPATRRVLATLGTSLPPLA